MDNEKNIYTPVENIVLLLFDSGNTAKLEKVVLCDSRTVSESDDSNQIIFDSHLYKVEKTSFRKYDKYDSSSVKSKYETSKNINEDIVVFSIIQELEIGSEIKDVLEEYAIQQEEIVKKKDKKRKKSKKDNKNISTSLEPTDFKNISSSTSETDSDSSPMIFGLSLGGLEDIMTIVNEYNKTDYDFSKVIFYVPNKNDVSDIDSFYCFRQSTYVKTSNGLIAKNDDGEYFDLRETGFFVTEENGRNAKAFNYAVTAPKNTKIWYIYDKGSYLETVYNQHKESEIKYEIPNEFIFENADAYDISEVVVVPEVNNALQTRRQTTPYIGPFDVRLIRNDAFMGNGNIQRIPLSSDEASGVFADMIDFAYKQDTSKVSDATKSLGITVDQLNELGKKKGFTQSSDKPEQSYTYSDFVRDQIDNGNSDTTYDTYLREVDKIHHALPRWKSEYGTISKVGNVYGLYSLINPYSITRLHNAVKIATSDEGRGLYASENRMLDIRDQNRFYDYLNIKDTLGVQNPSTTNIIQIMNNDRWGRTPYTYQDFVFCKYWNRIPNNRLITLRKYATPTHDNLCWEQMDKDRGKLSKSYAPIVTACTYFGGESGNSLKDLFSIQSGLNWEKIEAKIWDVTGDSGDNHSKVASELIESGGYASMFNMGGTALRSMASMLKFLGMARYPGAFQQGASEEMTQKTYNNLHDPNDNGPYANRIKGPLNRINEVMKRKEGIKFDHKINLKFSFKARPIGGVNTKVVMLEIISNMLMMCSASAVFWGGGHRFQITPHSYPWKTPGYNNFLKDVYNGNIFGQNGAIAKTVKGIVDIGHNGMDGKTGFDGIMAMMKNLGATVMGAFGGMVQGLIGVAQGAGMEMISNAVGNAWSAITKSTGMNANASFNAGKQYFGNIIGSVHKVWRENSMKATTLPQIQGMQSLLIGVPVGNWHLTVGNPLNPIAVIGNLICEDIKFEFGEELGPDDFPDELDCTVTLSHGMPRDLEAIESMFNRGTGRIYQAPDYLKMWGRLPSSEVETKVDAVTGGTAVRTPHAFQAIDGNANSGKYFKLSDGTSLSNHGFSSSNITTPINSRDYINFNRYDYTASMITSRSALMGTMHTRHYADS